MVVRSVSGVLAVLCCLPLSVRGDDLIPNGTRGPGRLPNPAAISDVLAQTLKHFAPPGSGGVVVYWYLRDGLLQKGGVDPADYRINLAPEKLEAIKDQWKRAGVTIEIQYKDGGAPLELNNCFMSSHTPEGYMIVSGLPGLPSSDLVPKLVRGGLVLHLEVDGPSPFRYPDGRPFRFVDIPLRNVETIEFREDGSLLVSPKGGDTFSGHVEKKPMKTAGGSLLDLVPSLSGFTYEPSGAYTVDDSESDKLHARYPESSKPYFKERTVGFPEMRNIRITNAVSGWLP